MSEHAQTQQTEEGLRSRIIALATQAFGLRNNQPEYAQEYAAEALRLAATLDFPDGRAEAVFACGVVASCSARYDEALQKLNEAAALFRAFGSRAGESRCARWLGVTYRNIGMPVAALEYSNQALALAEKSGSQPLIGFAHLSIGDAYILLNETEKATFYRSEALRIALLTDDKELQSQALWSMGRDEEQRGGYDAALNHYRRSYELRKEAGDALGMGTAKFGMASLLEKQGKRAAAFRILTELLQNFQYGSTVAPQAESFVRLEIGRLYANTAKPRRALPYLKRSLELARKIGLPTVVAAANEALAGYYKAQGDFARALEHFEEYHRHSAEIAQREARQTAQHFRQAFDFERAQKEAEIYRLRNEELAAANAQSEALLLNVLPAAIASRMKLGETTIAERFSDVTVLFADIVGFTELSATRSPEEVVDILNRVFSAFDIFSEQYNLEKIKTIGDAYMIIGGAPNLSENHVEAVAQMALEMLNTVRLLSLGMKLDLNIRIGLHVGAVVAGVIGQKKFSYDLWGDTVNIASRMESHGEAGKIHCTESVKERLASKNFRFEERGGVEIKGKGVMKTYFLTQ
jgi:class 3 adenylate cyclase